MNILITNDDGILADGIRALAEIMAELGSVTVVAPTHEHSAVSSKITVSKPLRVSKVTLSDTFTAFQVTGTPADCVKLALSELCDQKPDLLVSGINHGSNTGFNIIYSGTVAGAIEGMLNDIPSIAVSVASFTWRDFSLAKHVLHQLVPQVMKKGLPRHTLLNINLPPIKKDECTEIVFCELSENRYVEDFDKRLDPIGKPYFWLGGRKHEPDVENAVDDVFIKQNKVTIVPVKFEFNDKETMRHFDNWDLQ